MVRFGSGSAWIKFGPAGELFSLIRSDSVSHLVHSCSAPISLWCVSVQTRTAFCQVRFVLSSARFWFCSAPAWLGSTPVRFSYFFGQNRFGFGAGQPEIGSVAVRPWVDFVRYGFGTDPVRFDSDPVRTRFGPFQFCFCTRQHDLRRRSNR